MVGTNVRSPADIVKILSCDSIRSFTSDLFTLFKEPLIVVSVVDSVIAPVVVLYEPAVTCLMVTSPPSWGGRFRTKQNTIKGFPELQAKQLTTGYIPQQLRKIIRSK